MASLRGSFLLHEVTVAFGSPEDETVFFTANCPWTSQSNASISSFSFAASSLELCADAHWRLIVPSWLPIAPGS